MSKLFLNIYLLFAAALLATAAPDHDYTIPYEQLPEASRTFVRTHFAQAQVSYCLRDSHSFEVRFADGSEIEFHNDGSWKEIDCKYREIPASVTALLPESIPEYVKANFPTAIITKVNKKFRGFEVELDNGLEIKFSQDGTFRKIDD